MTVPKLFVSRKRCRNASVFDLERGNQISCKENQYQGVCWMRNCFTGCVLSTR